MTDSLPRVLLLGDPPLRLIAEPVVSKIGAQADLLAEAETPHAVLLNFRLLHSFGRAIAAPQIGVARQIVALNLNDGRIWMLKFWSADKLKSKADRSECFEWGHKWRLHA